MKAKGEKIRERIVEAANQLIYKKGFNAMSFADVAAVVAITKGNLHYHFNNKESLLQAVVEMRLAAIRQQLILWDAEFSEPKQRLKRFLQMLLNEQNELVRYGCPMGSLNMELAKQQTDLLNISRELFDAYLPWLERQFLLLKIKQSEQKARHFLSMAQGAALMCHVYHDQAWLLQECVVIEQWLDSLL